MLDSFKSSMIFSASEAEPRITVNAAVVSSILVFFANALPMISRAPATPRIAAAAPAKLDTAPLICDRESSAACRMFPKW